MMIGQLIVTSCSNIDLANVTTIGKTGPGIFMAYVQHAKLTNDRINGNCDGLTVIGSSDVNVTGSDISSNGTPGGDCRGQGITVSYTTSFTLTQSTISKNYEGIVETNTKNTTITRDQFNSNTYLAVSLTTATNATITRNQLQNTGGISLNNVANALIQENRVQASTTTAGLALSNIAIVLVEGNWISGPGPGIAVGAANGLNVTGNTLLYGSGASFGSDPLFGGSISIFNTIVYHNNFVFNTRQQAEHYYGVTINWDNGYPSGGNYWSDYTGVDNCSGANQNICPQLDGIGDTPYARIIQIRDHCFYANGTSCYRTFSSQVDHYPLIKPYGNVTLDKLTPQWPPGSILLSAKISSTSILLQWPNANDDTWVSKYTISENGTVIARVQGNINSYAVASLTTGSTYTFKIEASDPGNNTSVNGPSSTMTLLAGSNPPSPGQNPGTTPTTSNSSPWWTGNSTVTILIGSIIAIITITAGSILYIRRRVKH